MKTTFLYWFAVCLFLISSIAIAGNIYDKHEGYQGRVDERGNVYDKREKYIGRQEGCK